MKTIYERFKVNVIHQGKERWKYCTSLKRAEIFKWNAESKGIVSVIYKKVDGKYIAI